MNKTRLLGFLLIALLWMLWMVDLQKKQQAKVLEQRNKDSIQAVKEGKPFNPDKKEKSKEVSKEESESEEEVIKSNNQVVPEPQIAATKSELLSTDSIKTKIRKSIQVETNNFQITLDSKGAIITSVKIPDLKNSSNEKTLELINQGKEGALSLKIGRQKFSEMIWVTSESRKNITVKDGPRTISFMTNYKGEEIKRSYTFFPDSNSVRHEFYSSNLDEGFKLSWKAGMKETEKFNEGKGLGLNYGYFSELIFDDGEVSRENFKGTEKFNEEGTLNWAGLRRKYVAATIDFGKPMEYKITGKALINEDEDGSEKMHSYSLSILGDYIEKGSLNFNFVVLPLEYRTVLAQNKNYEKIIFTGFNFLGANVWYPKLCGLVLNLLNYFNGFFNNYGFSIILLTLLVKILLLPLTLTQTRSMAKTQEHMPQIKKIREKFKGNPKKIQQETMAYYKEVGVNPLAPLTGCLPVFLQFPVFIALFNVLGRAVELKGEPWMLWVTDLSMPDVILESVKIPFIFPLGLTILPFFMAITMYFQTKMTITDPNQKAMVYMMPLMMFMFSSSFPSGLVLYWTVSNVFTIGQTWIMKRKKNVNPQGIVSAQNINISSKKKTKKV